MTRAADAPTMTEALRRTAASHPEIVAVRTADGSIVLTWSELLGRVDAVAGGLAKLGVRRGETVAIMLGNGPEFHIVDLAVATLGATPFSIYVTYPPEEIEYLIGDAEAQVAVVEQAYLPAMLEARRRLPNLSEVIVVDGDPPTGTIALAEVEGSAPEFDAAAAAAEVAPGQAGIDETNSHLARVEQIKKFTIVRGDWLPGGDELTPTMKLKRRPIALKYGDEIEAMYR